MPASLNKFIDTCLDNQEAAAMEILSEGITDEISVLTPITSLVFPVLRPVKILTME